MLKNYFKIAIRSIRKNRIYTMINVVGLSVALASVLVIVSYVRLELSYDTFHPDYQKIYRITEHRMDDGRRIHSATTFNPLGELIKAHVPAVEQLVRMYPIPVYVSSDRENRTKVSKFTLVDSLFFDFFKFEPVHGKLESSLDNPFSAVLTVDQAIHYFGTTNIVGRDLYVEDETESFVFQVTAIIKEIPQNVHFNPGIIGSLRSIETIQPWFNNWHHPPLYTYVRLNDGFEEQELVQQIKDMGEIHFPDYIKAEKRTYEAQNIGDIHLNSALELEWQPNSRQSDINMFMLIALFILLIACVNFMNLATVQSVRRAMEVGLRKVMGAARNQLVFQFMGEAFLITFISMLIGLGIAELVLKYFFDSIINKQVSMGFLFTGSNFLGLIVIVLIVSLLAGAYPAFYLSALKPINSLRTKMIKVSGFISLRKIMVTTQFLISCLLIIGTLLVLRQTNYLRSKDPGFNKESVVALRMVERKDQTNYKILKDALLQEKDVLNVALSSTLPGTMDFYGWNVIPEGYPEDTEYTMRSLGVDEDYLDTYDIELITGRQFSKDISTDGTQAFILNQAAVESLGWDDPLNKEFSMIIYTGKRELRKGKIIGVVKDFHFQSLYNKIEPLVLYINKHPHYSDFLNIKLAPGNIQQQLQMLSARWKAFNPDKPMEYYFIDQEIARFYDRELKISKIFTAFAIISIIISCLGLFGLSAFTTTQRTKEIGVRKVHGASITGIIRLLSKEYVMLILIANLITWPLAWYLGKQWLNGFPYRISFSADLFLITLLSALFIGLLTVSFQSLKAATANPVNSLRSE